MFMSKVYIDNWVEGFTYLMDNKIVKKSNVQIANETGYNAQHISNVRRRRDEPGVKFLEIISENIGYTVEKIVATGQQIKEGKPVDANSNNETSMDNFQLVPMAKAKPKGGTSSLEVEGGIERHYAFRIDFLFRKGSPNNMILFRVGGDSMYPFVADGDTVLVDKSQTHLHDGKMYLVRIDDDIIVKWILRKPGQYILRSENKLWDDIIIEKKDESIDFQVLGKVVWIGKEIT
mgnify:CR=1 FL=1